MAALAKARNTQTRGRIVERAYKVKASTKIYQGSIVVVDATGYAVPGSTATGELAVGIATATADNSSGASGDINVNVLVGEGYFANSGGDLVVQAAVNSTVYIVDDQTVSKTSATGAESAAGLCTGFDSGGVWVRIGTP